jgi:prefoldin subunit 5
MDESNLKRIITDWVRIDNEIRELQKQQNTRKSEKKRISATLMSLMNTQDLDRVNILDGEIKYVKRNVKKPISKKILMSLLDNYYPNDVDKSRELSKYILDNRDESIKESITRKIT